MFLLTVLMGAYMYLSSIIPPVGILGHQIRYAELYRDGRIECGYRDIIPTHEIHRVKWFRSSRDDIFEKNGPAVVSWDGTTQPYTSDNYGIDEDFSLTINNMTESDTGIYCCVVSLKTSGRTYKFFAKLVTYSSDGNVVYLTAEHGTHVSIPCRYNLTTNLAKAGISDVVWHKDGEAILEWLDISKDIYGPEDFTDDILLEIRNISFVDTGMYECITLGMNEKAASAAYTYLIVYALPRDGPHINVSTISNTTVVNCSVNYVYPLLYPEFRFHHDKEYSVQNDDGTYNTSISCIVPDSLHNRTVECFFPHFNYTESSSHYIPANIAKDECTQHHSECTAKSRLGMMIGLTCVGLLVVSLATTVIWKMSRKCRKNEADGKIPETEHNDYLTETTRHDNVPADDLDLQPC